MTTHDDKVKALLKAIDDWNEDSGQWKDVMQARRAFDPPQPEAPERVWIKFNDASSKIERIKWWSTEAFDKTAYDAEYIRADTAIKRKAGGVEGWYRLHNGGTLSGPYLKSELFKILADEFSGRAVHLVETEPS